MYTGKYISSKAIIDKIYRDYGFRPTDIDEEAVLENIYDVMMLIGVPTAFVDEESVVEITNYRGELPCGLIDLTSLRLHGQQIALQYSSDRFYMDHTNAPATTGIDNNAPYVDQYSTMPSIMGAGTSNKTFTYTINNGYIFTNWQTGSIDIVYKAFPTDENGWPEIPDNVRYTKAVEAYVAERIGFKQWMKGELTDKVYAKLEQERLWYIPSAANALRIPGLDQMESIKNQWLTLIPNITQQAYGFRYLNRRQRIRTGTV